MLYPVSPNSDQHQISPCNINAYSTPGLYWEMLVAYFFSKFIDLTFDSLHELGKKPWPLFSQYGRHASLETHLSSPNYWAAGECVGLAFH